MKSNHHALIAFNVAAIIFTSHFTCAQSPAPAPKGVANSSQPQPPSDPFIRQPQNTKPPDGVARPGDVGDRPVNLLSTLETWTLKQSDLLLLLETSGDERGRYAHLERLAETGKAKLTGLIAITCKSNQRSVVESIDEVRYPTEFSAPAAPGEIAYPTTWQTRNVGDTMELETIAGPDRPTIDVNLVPQTVHLAGVDEWRAEPGAPATASVKFETAKITTSLPVKNGEPALLATATLANLKRDAAGEIQTQIQWLRVTAQTTPAAPAPVKNAGNVRVEFQLYSLDRETARRILISNADSAKSYAAVRELLAKGEAQLEVLRAFVTKSGQRAVLEEQGEVTFPASATGPSFETRAGAPPARQPASFNAFETRNSGLVIEIEPVVDPEGNFVDINIVPQIVEVRGMLELGGISAKYPAQPLFTTRKLTTSATSRLSMPILLGTMSHPRANGVNAREDDNRTSLAYVRVTPARP